LADWNYFGCIGYCNLENAMIMCNSIVKKSFHPLISEDTEILILGSMPGEASLSAGEYYAHPRNKFWKMMANITNEPFPTNYTEKKELLSRHKIGLWDVAKSVNRKGSLDKNISNAIVNDIETFLKTHPKIKTIGFNGKKAEELFSANFQRHANTVYLSLPSTSPANAQISFETSCMVWNKILIRRIVILGGGESGAGAAVLAKKQGFDVFLSDFSAIKPKYKAILEKYGIAYEENRHTEELILKANEVIKSPGIPDKASIVKKIQEQGIPIISEIEFGGRYTEAKTICITGSNGKTTTTMLTYHILKSAGLNVGLAGNVGDSFALQVAEENYDCYVIELSSFQLDGMYDFKADIAILLNITPDHLDRYNYEMQNYVNAKMRILQNQTSGDAFIFWNDDPIVQKEIEKRHPPVRLYPFAQKKEKGAIAYTENKQLIIETPKGIFNMEEDLIALTGTHNLYNSLAAGIAAKLMDIKNEDIRKSLSDFEGVEHRLEKVARVRCVEYINDSKATNVNSTWYALQSMKTPVVLILGGTDKGNDYKEIDALVKNKCRALIFLGLDNSKLHAFFDGKVGRIADALSMKEAVSQAYELAEKGDTVLLSPCCASFDLFQNYEDRGCQFKDCVRNL
jgi:UDP-N-acetylmuramoylalanine--D-glutamate ligase